MKTIGLIGGMSWQSSIEYYRIVNEEVEARLGGLHSAKSVMYSVDFAEVEALQHRGEWQQATRIMAQAACNVERGGADFFIICTNTMHKMAPAVQDAVGIPLLHIADATADQVKARGVRKVGLLGTRFTMEEDFYKGRLVQAHGLDVVTPDARGRDDVHRVIYEELCKGRVEQGSKRRYCEVVEELVGLGSEAVILGCTEIGLLLGQADSPVPLFDTTRLHAVAAVEYALAP